MDNVCHTLVGAALARTGLDRRTPLGAATLMIGANFPDLDVIAVPLGMGLEWRRGLTHGIPALIVLPFVLTAVMLAWDRVVRRRRGAAVPADPRALLLLSAMSTATHPVLDWMNVYGMRWLMPFDSRWFYGDTLFIVDPWIWGALAVGVVATGRRRKRGDDAIRARRPAVWSLAAVAVYIAGMFLLGRTGERVTRAELAALGVGGIDRVMVAPVPVNPFRRQVVVSLEQGTRYRFGDLRWTPGPAFTLREFVLESGMHSPLAARARAAPRGAGFLGWARFPFVLREGRGADGAVWLGDARYAIDPEESWAAVRIDDRAVPSAEHE